MKRDLHLKLRQSHPTFCALTSDRSSHQPRRTGTWQSIVVSTVHPSFWENALSFVISLKSLNPDSGQYRLLSLFFFASCGWKPHLALPLTNPNCPTFSAATPRHPSTTPYLWLHGFHGFTAPRLHFFGYFLVGSLVG
ncbi:hypothetical protein TorRG33x02_154710 [Trema orientale]|uniref:Uncharacterized protein n=1 Tax=Trema orientale TaxID=63057 RepID=A0A2P5ETE1_TREOI|nr:hypothetical protein TorRG33x02_154710 [Trema orientale]